MKKATKDDAEVFFMLQESFDSPRMEEAFKWFMKEFEAKDYKEFIKKYPMDSEGYGNVSRVLATFELAGVLISQGLLNENLYFDSSGAQFLWPRLEKIIPGWQKAMSPAIWENAVWLMERQKQWNKEVWKPNLAWKPDRPGASRKSR